jgi:uncharacterized protein YbaP (TraB family)
MMDLAHEATRDQRETERLNQILLWGRHPAMMQNIEGYLASGEVHFVAVGSLHLVGERGLVSLLKEKGYKVRQL